MTTKKWCISNCELPSPKQHLEHKYYTNLSTNFRGSRKIEPSVLENCCELVTSRQEMNFVANKSKQTMCFSRHDFSKITKFDILTYM